MNDTLDIIPEPMLEFRYGQKMERPHDGLALFGPYDVDMPAHPRTITYGIIGTQDGINSFNNWSALFDKCILPPPSANSRLWPPFPGFSSVTDATWSLQPAWSHEIDRQSLIEASRNLDPNRRAYEVVNHFMRAFATAKKRDENFSVFICVVPDELWKNCRPKSVVANGLGQKVSRFDRNLRKQGQTELFERFEPEQYQLSVDFRRQLKARAMEFGIPIQIVRESTLATGDDLAKRRLTPVTDRAWNLCTAIYYKGGGKPWRLSTARDGVCYIGIAFRKEEANNWGRTACCAAQMFLDSGDGLVFLGEYGPWYSPTTGQFHLTREAARRLLTGVLETYQDLHGKKLAEVFLHSRSSISDEEFKGYAEACSAGVKLVGVRVRSERQGLRAYRLGDWPVLRGTFWKLNDKTGYLWASGFKPILRTYDGWDVPAPLRIDIQHGDAEIRNVATDILGLTKLNYNSCHVGDSQPVTVLFSDAVGEILVSNPMVAKRNPSFKFYI
jgi:hypothetical protein